MLNKLFGGKRKEMVQISRVHLIRIPIKDSKSNYLEGFWQWVKLLEAGDYQRALESLYWENGTTWTAEKLKKRVTTFFGGNDPWTVVIPNDRLINEINKAAKVEFKSNDFDGWFMAQIPLTTEPENPKDDEIPLMGLAVSFFVRKYEGFYVLEHEIFHL